MNIHLSIALYLQALAYYHQALQYDVKDESALLNRAITKVIYLILHVWNLAKENEFVFTFLSTKQIYNKLLKVMIMYAKDLSSLTIVMPNNEVMMGGPKASSHSILT